jgi:biopolymer transport protein ExbD
MFKHLEQMEIDKRRRERREKSRTGTKDIDIDMNPMVDLAFLLLTFFMLTTTFNQPLIMDILTPVKPKEENAVKEQAVKESKTMTIILSDENRVFWFMGVSDPEVKETDFSSEGIREIIIDKQQSVEGLVVLVKGDNNSVYQDLVNLLDELQNLKVERYAVVDLTPEEEELIQPIL